MANFFKSTDPSVLQATTQTPQQQQVSSGLLGLLPQAQQSFNFEPIAQAAQQRFQQQTLPGIAERFGGMQAKRSSGFNQAKSNAFENLQTNLAGQEAQFGLQSQGNLANLLGMGLQPQFENIFLPGEESGAANLLGQLLPIAFSAMTGGFGGGEGMDFGKIFANMFGGGQSRGGQSRGGQSGGGPTTQTQGILPRRSGGGVSGGGGGGF